MNNSSNPGKSVHHQGLLEIRDLTVKFKSDRGLVTAADQINLRIDAGETLGILGESGSGKSVTALSVLRLLPEKHVDLSGSVLFQSKGHETVDLLCLDEQELRHYRGNCISMIFQEPMTSLNPVMTCGHQVAEGLRIHKKISQEESKSKVYHWFDEVRLPDPARIYNSYPFQLSGGQRQRVMIAMAMCCEPDLLIADEPTTALDVTVQKTIIDLMISLQQKYQMSILFITHDISLVSQIAGRVAVMKNGRIIEEGQVFDIIRHPQQSYTKGLIASRPPVSSRPLRLMTVQDYLNLEGSQFPAESKFITRDQRNQELEKIYSSAPLLEIKNLNTLFRTGSNMTGRKTKFKHAVKDVSLQVFRGETLGLVGESGCGKTTLGRTVLRLIEAGSGEIIYDGVNICTIRNKELRKLRKKIQIIFQDPYSSLNPGITIGDSILEPMKVHFPELAKNDAIAKLNVLLEKTGLNPGFSNHYPHELSGGQRQRVVIARALATGPEFIICDEPVSALDVSIQAQVLNLLNDLKNDFRLTYIFISHDLSVVRYMSDRIVVMKNGSIEETGDADELFEHPRKEYTQTLINAIPLIPAES